MKNTALMISGIVFLLVAIMHVARLAFQIEITVAGRVLPMSLSFFGFLFAVLISAWMFRVMRG